MGDNIVCQIKREAEEDIGTSSCKNKNEIMVVRES
jgi:hypothetical protein